jgi:hypothetical protein
MTGPDGLFPISPTIGYVPAQPRRRADARVTYVRLRGRHEPCDDCCIYAQQQRRDTGQPATVHHARWKRSINGRMWLLCEAHAARRKHAEATR